MEEMAIINSKPRGGGWNRSTHKSSVDKLTEVYQRKSGIEEGG